MENQQEILTTRQAAAKLGIQAATLKQSRHTGILFGEPAPTFLKMGRSTRYKLTSLIEFLNQFPEYRNTSQYGSEAEGSR